MKKQLSAYERLLCIINVPSPAYKNGKMKAGDEYLISPKSISFMSNPRWSKLILRGVVYESAVVE